MASRSDNFNRADSTTALGTPSDGGSSWVALSGTWGISSNVAYKVSTGNAGNPVVLESSAANVEVSATLTTINSLSAPGLIARASDNSNYISLQARGSGYGSGNLELYRVVAGAATSRGSWTGTLSAGDVIMLRCDGDTINCYQNGVLRIGPVTESHNNTATQHGLQAYYSGSGGDTGSNSYACRHDDFVITDLAAGGGGGWFVRDRKRTYMSPLLRR